jgi:PhoH-like ATPase
MPLPPAPTQRASILPKDAYQGSSAKSKARRSAKAAAAEPEAIGHPAAFEASVTKPGPPARQGASSTASPTASPTASSTASPPARPAARAAAGEASSTVERDRREGGLPKKPAPTADSPAMPASTEAAPAIETAKQRRPQARQRSRASQGPTKLFVLDTNVLLHDPMCLFRFEEHDIFLPMIVLEELDGHKKGMTEVARNARQTSRTLDALAAEQGADIAKGLQLSSTGHTQAGGHLLFQTRPLSGELPMALPQGKADNQILGVVEALRKELAPREVVLVSKDINMRVKARALGLSTEDYRNDKTLEDGDLLYSGALPLPPDFWTRQSKTIESWQQGSHTFYRISGPIVESLLINQFTYFEAPGEPPLYARVTEIRGKTAVLKTLKDYTHLKNAVWGVTMRNREQNFAMNLLMDPEVDFVTLTGTAGTGKTLMTLAAGLTQVLDDRRYTEIIMTRATVSVGEDIGFLPGTEEEKMGPWMGALDDNLEVLAKNDTGAGEWGRAATNELIRSRIKVKSMNFMRGRTFLNKYVIIDEAQNLTPKQMKTLITRAGPGTKIICMGNLAQIDTPYLTEGSSGLTYAVDRFKGWPHGGHITLARGERSRLADFASEVL